MKMGPRRGMVSYVPIEGGSRKSRKFCRDINGNRYRFSRMEINGYVIIVVRRNNEVVHHWRGWK